MSEDYSNIKCCGVKKNGVKCTNAAKFYQSDELAFCKVHYVKDDDDYIELTKDLSCNVDKCKRQVKYKINEKCYSCGIHIKPENSDLFRYYTINNTNDTELRILLFKSLDKFNFKELNIKTILIERQPKLATERMRSVSYALYDYFIMHCNYNIDVIWMDPKNKLHVYDGPVITCDLKNPYNRNKWFACEYCKWQLNKKTESSYYDFFIDNKKKDDLADCYLQGLYHLDYSKKKDRVMSDQQRNVYTEQNLIKYKKIKAVKPKAGKKCTLSGIKYYIYNNMNTALIKSNIEYYFGENYDLKLLVRS